LTKKPFFGLVVALVGVVAIVAACYGLKAIGDTRSDEVGGRSAANMGESNWEKPLVMGVLLINNSEVPIQLGAEEVKRSQWAYDTFPDSDAPLGLTGLRIEPGGSAAVKFLSMDSKDSASFKLLVTPVSGSSTSGAISMYQFKGQWKNVDGAQDIMWLWPNAKGPSRYSLETRECGPPFADEAARYESNESLRRIIASVECTPNGAFIGTMVTFTDSSISEGGQAANQTK
jgi:hypothetical protein